MSRSWGDRRAARWVGICALLAAAAVTGAAGVAESAAAPDTITAAILKDRAATEEWLKGASTSYLAAVRRLDFEQWTTLTVGRAADNQMRLDDSTVTEHHLRVTVVGDSFQVEAVDLEARFMSNQVEMRAGTLPPSSIGVGRFILRLSHQRFPALILFDPKSPRFAAFKGLRYYPVDLAYRYVVRLEPNPNPDTTIILSTRGSQRRAIRAGWFSFQVGGKQHRLEVTRLLEPGVGETDYSVFFRDATSGKDTYEIGRYVDVTPVGDGSYVLDFNAAYNPACAFSEHYNCPIPPKENRLKVAIKAGEMDSHYLDH